MLLVEKRLTPFENKRLLIIVLWTRLCVIDNLIVEGFDFNPGSSNRPEQLVPCHVPTGETSFCVPLARCTQLTALVKNLQKPIPGDVAKYIKDSFFCTKRGPADPSKVCCPFNSIIDPKPTNRPPIRKRGMKYNLTCVKIDSVYISKIRLITFK